jgi:lysophospholipase L1-like esterase
VGRFRHRFQSIAVLAVVASLVVVATGCKREVTKEVLFVNDSVTHQSIIAIVSEMNNIQQTDAAGRYAPNFGASNPGIGLRQVPLLPTSDDDSYWHDALTSLLGHVKPEVIVVELGYNDCGFDLSDYGAHIDNFMSVIPSDTPVHWLTVADARNMYTCDETMNAALTAATTRWSNLTLFDFAGFMTGHPEWTADSKHLNAAGQGAYAKWLHQQLDAIYLPH